MGHATSCLEEATMTTTYTVEYLRNPDQSTLRQLALRHSGPIVKTAHDNLNKISRNKARMAAYTYVIAEESAAATFSHKVISPTEAARLIERQREYIETEGQLIAIEGYYGLGKHAVGVEWLYTLEGANIAGMQQVLAFERAHVESPAQQQAPFAPTFQIVFTPGCSAEGLPGKQAIIVDLDRGVTYIMGPDYFGESKKGVLRMLCASMYDEGALVMHAGAKVVELGGKRISVGIMGLSGTGKTTTTFSKQGTGTQPVQDDMITLWPGGDYTVTENGCFAKTFGLTPASEPVIYNGTVDPTAWVENVFVGADGKYDFSKGILTPQEVAKWKETLIATGAPAEHVEAYITGKNTTAEILDAQGIPKDGWDFVVWTQNGRSIIPLSAVHGAADLTTPLPPIRSMGTLNRDEGPLAATPGLVRFTSPEQAAGFFMLGETSKTSAAGKERGKTRSPFTQPFFPLSHDLQAQRFKELAATMPACQMWMMNTGYIGGTEREVDAGKALKVKIRHSSALLEALFSGTVVWKKDPDFGYEIPDPDAKANAALLAVVPAEILEPRRFFAKTGREAEYATWVTQMHTERRAFLQKYHVDQAIINATCGK
ncbi:MAG: phosphoenolpyruvate carboxykinase (ATP) [Deltaproteobacteria bacterium]|nr:phosphoenolpyruvate carboxykinase (ATP) [Deltaproteobacteria bacterium]